MVVSTGASSGLGLGFARATAAVADELRRSTTVLTHRTDVSRPEKCHDLAAAAVAEFGRVDVLVNSAGLGPAGRRRPQRGPDVFGTVINVNSSAPTGWLARPLRTCPRGRRSSTSPAAWA